MVASQVTCYIRCPAPMAVVAKFARFAGPSVVAAVLGSAFVALVDAVPNSYDVVAGMAAAGFISLLGVPVLLALALLVRWLWSTWALDRSNESGADQHAVACAWIAYALWATAGFAIAVFHTVMLVFTLTSSRNVVALSVALVSPAFALLLVALARPCVGVIEHGVVRLRRPLLVLATSALSVSVIVWATIIRGRVGTLDLGFAWAIVVGLAVFLLVHPLLLQWRQRWLKPGLVVASVAVLAQLVATGWVVTKRPYALLALWGDAPLAGTAIDKLVSIQDFREGIDVGEFRPVEVPGAAHPNVVLITVDTVRADRTPMHGGPAKMPKLAAFARLGTVFEWAFSAGNVTRRSLPSMATGLLPGKLRGRVVGWALRMDPRHILVAERFKAAGYDTAGFFCCTSHFAPKRNLGLHRGFDEVIIERDGADLAQAAEAWLAQREKNGASEPAFVWIHLFDPHEWAKDFPRKKHGGSVRSRYDKSLEAVDKDLAPLLARLSLPTTINSTLTVISSDHGEGLGDHGERYHAGTLFNSEIHVPLVVVGPSVRRGRVSEPVSLTDLAPSLLEMAGFHKPKVGEMDGRSFADLAKGKRLSDVPRGRAFVRMVRDRSVDTAGWALVAGRYKVVVGEGRPRLYEYVNDRGEMRNLAKKHADKLAELLEEFEAWRRADRSNPF